MFSNDALGFGRDDDRLREHIPKVFPDSPTDLRSDAAESG